MVPGLADATVVGPSETSEAAAATYGPINAAAATDRLSSDHA